MLILKNITKKPSPILSCLGLKEIVKSAHLAGCYCETRQVSGSHADFLDQSVQGPSAIFANLVWGSPEDDHRVAIRPVQELIKPPGHPEHAGVGDHPQSGLVPDVSLKPQRRRVVHANHTLRAVDLCSRAAVQDVAGARHQRALMTMKGHALKRKDNMELIK